MWRGLLLALCAAAYAQSSGEAVHELARRTIAHLGANEIAHVTARNASSLSGGDASKIQVSFEREMRRRIRNASTVEVALTISENARGFLLIAQVGEAVEMAAFRMEAEGARMTPAVAKTMIWEQDAPVLDVWAMDDLMVVLDTQNLTVYEHGKPAAPVAIPGPMPRDPRGRLEVSGSELTALLPGTVCRGTLKPVSIECAPGGEIAAGRNTLNEPDWPAHYSRVHAGESDFVGETDGRVHVFDATGKETGAFDGWGSDFAAVCGGSRFLATGRGNRDTRDSIAVFDLTSGAPVRVSEFAEFPGPVTALSATTAVARNLSTGRYEAYTLKLDCGR